MNQRLLRSTFLPLTTEAIDAAAESSEGVDEVRRRLGAAHLAARGCWAALLGGCDSPDRKVLPDRLRALSEATTIFVRAHHGAYDAYSPGPSFAVANQHRASRAERRIDDAVRDGDGAEYAEAFIDYDQAVAAVFLSARAEWRTTEREQ